MGNAGHDLLSLQILLQAVEETLAAHEHDPGRRADVERLGRLRDDLRADLRDRSVRLD
jgi:hypothetical protein